MAGGEYLVLFKKSQMFNNPTDAVKFEKVVPPYFWSKYNLTVLYDRHLPNGIRQHVVAEHVPNGTILDNAEIYWNNDPEVVV